MDHSCERNRERYYEFIQINYASVGTYTKFRVAFDGQIIA